MLRDESVIELNIHCMNYAVFTVSLAGVHGKRFPWACFSGGATELTVQAKYPPAVASEDAPRVSIAMQELIVTRIQSIDEFCDELWFPTIALHCARGASLVVIV